MRKIFTKKWFEAAGIRAIRTFAQAAIASISAAAAISEVDWKLALGSAVLAAILSMLMSLSGLPELTDEDQDG